MPVPEFADSNLSKLINIFLPVIIIYSHVSYNFTFDLGNDQKTLPQFPTTLERCIGFDFKLRDKFIKFAASCNEFLLSDFA